MIPQTQVRMQVVLVSLGVRLGGCKLSMTKHGIRAGNGVLPNSSSNTGYGKPDGGYPLRECTGIRFAGGPL